MFRFLIFLIFLAVGIAKASEDKVEKVCRPSRLPIVKLEFKNRKLNVKRIIAASLGRTDLGRYVDNFYSSESTNDPLKIQEAASRGNLKFIPTSELKELFLQFSTRSEREKDPEGYKRTLVKLVNLLVPKELNKLPRFMELKDPIISSVKFQPASVDETGQVYGAVTRINKVSIGKYDLEIIFSNNESEPIPYLIPLIVHELQHALSYKEKAKIDNDEEYFKLLIVEEAKAFEVQLQTYLALAKNNPELFCNWLYPTWAYGEILVPLSWTMAAMEKRMREGKYIYDYAKLGEYKDKKYLLNSKGTDLDPALKIKIKNLHLEFVK